MLAPMSAICLQHLVIALITSGGFCITAYNTFAELNFLKDQLNTNATLTISTHEKTNSMRCARLCKHNDGCTAVQVNEISQECQLLLSAPLVNETVQQTGWVTHRKICHLGYREEAGLCFKLFDISLSKSDARLKCEEDGGRLLRIQSQRQQDTVAGYLAMQEYEKNPTVAGTESSGVWILEDGSPMEYFAWEKTPNNAKQTNIKLAHAMGYAWQQSSSEREGPFICEIVV